MQNNDQNIQSGQRPPVTVKRPTLARFTQWARDNAPLAHDVLVARTIAAMERKRVDDYIAPVFAKFYFTDSRTGEVITKPDDLYRALDDQEAECQEFYAACDAEHRRHGFTGPTGHCPALTAEHDVIIAERALLDALSALMGADFSYVYGENREKALDLALGACLSGKAAA